MLCDFSSNPKHYHTYGKKFKAEVHKGMSIIDPGEVFCQDEEKCLDPIQVTKNCTFIMQRNEIVKMVYRSTKERITNTQPEEVLEPSIYFL